MSEPIEILPYHGGLSGDDYITNCVFCGWMAGDVPICDICWRMPNLAHQKEIDKLVLAMPTDWPSYKRHKKRIALAKKRSPEHITKPWRRGRAK